MNRHRTGEPEIQVVHLAALALPNENRPLDFLWATAKEQAWTPYAGCEGFLFSAVPVSAAVAAETNSGDIQSRGRELCIQRRLLAGKQVH